MGISADPARLDAFFGDANVPDEDKRAVAAQLRAKPAAPAPAAEGVYPQPGDDVSITGALREGVSNIGRAVTSVLKPPAEALQRVTGGLGRPDYTLGKAASDVATVAGTALAPEVAAAQVGVGAATRALAPESTAQTAETVTGALGLGAQMVGAGVGAAKSLAGRGARAAETGGALVKERIPRAAEDIRKRVQAAHYEPAAAFAKEKGLGLQGGSPEATALADTLNASHAKWGATDTGTTLASKLRSTGQNVSYDDLDAAKRLLPGRAKEARGAVDAAISKLVEGTPAGENLAAGHAAWKLEVAPARALAKRVARAEDPESALRLLADAKHPARVKIAQQMFGGTPDDWHKVLDGMTALRPSRAAAIGRGMQHHGGRLAAYSGAMLHPQGVIAGLALAGGGEAVKHAGTAAQFLKGGLAGRPAAAALADTISAWGEGQDEKAKTAAHGVASALRGGSGSLQSQAGISAQRGAAPAAPSTIPQGAGVSSRPFDREISRVASVVGVDPTLLHAVAQQESSYNPRAVGPAGPGGQAHGMMQLTPETFESLRPEVEHLVGRRANIYNPIDSLAASALLWKKYLARTGGSVENAARFYYGGENTGQHGPKTFAYGQQLSQRYKSLRGSS